MAFGTQFGARGSEPFVRTRFIAARIGAQFDQRGRNFLGHQQAKTASKVIMPGGKTVVFYDGSCPLCRAEVNLYRDQDRADAFRFCDVSQPTTDLLPGLDRDLALKRFHVLSAEGQLLSGAAAFLEVWRHLPGWRLSASLGRLPWMKFIFDMAYRRFLLLRPSLVRIFVVFQRLQAAWRARSSIRKTRKRSIYRARCRG